MLRIVNNSEIGQRPGDKAIAELLNVRFNSFMQALAQQTVPAAKRGVFMKQAAAVLSAAGIHQDDQQPARASAMIHETTMPVVIPEAALRPKPADPVVEGILDDIMREIDKLTDACCIDLAEIAHREGPKSYSPFIGPVGSDGYAVQIRQDNGDIILDTRIRYVSTLGGLKLHVSTAGKFQQSPAAYPQTVEAVKALHEWLKTK